MFETRPRLVQVLLIWLLLELVAAGQAQHGGGSVLGGWLHTATQPLTRSGGAVVAVVRDLVWGLGNQQELLRQLQEQEEELEQCRAERNLLSEDAATLREALSLPSTLPLLSDTGVVGRCLYRNLGLGTMEVTGGRVQGVAPDTAVVASGGLVGRVTRVAGRTCWIELLTSAAAGVAVRTAAGGVAGIAVGTEGGLLQVHYVPRRAQILRGTSLLTSGEDGIYPPGLPVASVVTVREGSGPFLNVVAAPAADLAHLRVVVLLTNWPASPPTGTAP